MRFESKKDLWIGLVIWIPVLYGFYMTGYVSFYEDQSPILFAIFVLVIGFIAWIWFGTYYVCDEESLTIRCGPIREIVPYKRIISVKRTRNPLSSAALSLDRIEINYGKITMISPANKVAFLAELEKMSTPEYF